MEFSIKPVHDAIFIKKFNNLVRKMTLPYKIGYMTQIEKNSIFLTI